MNSSDIVRDACPTAQCKLKLKKNNTSRKLNCNLSASQASKSSSGRNRENHINSTLPLATSKSYSHNVIPNDTSLRGYRQFREKSNSTSDTSKPRMHKEDSLLDFKRIVSQRDERKCCNTSPNRPKYPDCTDGAISAEYLDESVSFSEIRDGMNAMDLNQSCSRFGQTLSPRNSHGSKLLPANVPADSNKLSHTPQNYHKIKNNSGISLFDSSRTSSSIKSSKETVRQTATSTYSGKNICTPKELTTLKRNGTSMKQNENTTESPTFESASGTENIIHKASKDYHSDFVLPQSAHSGEVQQDAKKISPNLILPEIRTTTHLISENMDRSLTNEEATFNLWTYRPVLPPIRSSSDKRNGGQDKAIADMIECSRHSTQSKREDISPYMFENSRVRRLELKYLVDIKTSDFYKENARNLLG